MALAFATPSGPHLGAVPAGYTQPSSASALPSKAPTASPASTQTPRPASAAPGAAAATAAVLGVLGLRARRTGAARRAGRRASAKVARASVVAAVAAAASAAKNAAIGISIAGQIAGIKEGEDEKPAPRHKSGRKPKVVVLGTGWGAATFINGLSKKEAQMYDITVVSPRNFFLYTPLLPACTMGSIEERSIVTPIRRLLAGKGDYLEAKCEEIDTVKKVIRCCRAGAPENPSDVSYERFPKGDVEGKMTFMLDYDILIYSVGAQTNDFNTPGVKKNAFFFKEMPDARRVRDKVVDLFERAALPTTTPEDRDKCLSFVIVGGGPTGVEVAADLADFIDGEAGSLYPKLIEHVKIRLINTGDSLLSTYDIGISKESMEVFSKKGVEVMPGYRVVEVTPDEVKMKRASDGESVALKYGCTVWAAGIKEHSLTRRLKESLIQKNEGVSELNVTSLQAPAKGIITDEWLHVRGSAGSIFAIGDAATVRHDRTLPFAKQLFDAADAEGTGVLKMARLRQLFEGGSDAFPQLEEYAEYLSTVVEIESEDDPRIKPIANLFGSCLKREREAFRKAWALTQERVGDRTAKKGFEAIAEDFHELEADSEEGMGFETFKKLLARVDNNLRPFPPTAQVAAQQGKYLAKLLAKGIVAGDDASFKEQSKSAGAFTYFHKGALAYLGGGSAAFDLPVVGPVTGPAAGVAWKFYEASAQLSWKNRALVGLDWLREGLWGRDTSHL